PIPPPGGASRRTPPRAGAPASTPGVRLTGGTVQSPPRRHLALIQTLAPSRVCGTAEPVPRQYGPVRSTGRYLPLSPTPGATHSLLAGRSATGSRPAS